MNYTHEQVCKEYNRVKNTVTDTIQHQQIRLAFESNPNYRVVQMKRNNGNIREFLHWFTSAVLLIGGVMFVVYMGV